jgi:hypothetical protein
LILSSELHSFSRRANHGNYCRQTQTRSATWKSTKSDGSKAGVAQHFDPGQDQPSTLNKIGMKDYYGIGLFDINLDEANLKKFPR